MPIEFSCPHCHETMSVADKFAGTSGPCRSCGNTITIPQLAHAPAQKGCSTVVILTCIGGGLVFMILILMALLLPAVSAAREAARRNGCINNARMITLAILNYEAANGHLPPAVVTDDQGNPMHSWRVLILPYLEEGALYAEYDMDKPWNSPENMAVTATMPGIYCCPSEPAESTFTNYAVVVGPNTAFPGTSTKKISHIKDGVSQTVGVVETTGTNIHWSEPVDIPIARVATDACSNHAGGVTVVSHLDGSTAVVPGVSPSDVIINDGQ